MPREGWVVTYDPEEDHGQILYTGTDPLGGTVTVHHTIQFQHGPIGENGINGIQNEEVIELLIERIKQLDLRMPCAENQRAISHLGGALTWLQERTAKRVKQGVEGTVRPHSSTEEIINDGS